LAELAHRPAWRHIVGWLFDFVEKRGEDMIYTRFSTDVVFLLPTIAAGIGDKLWVEIAWLGFAVGIKKGEWNE
jgi:hypothetical protein